MFPTPQTPAQAAAFWWATHLHGIAPQDNGDTSPQGGMAATMYLQLAAQSQHPEAECLLFAHHLERLVQAQLQTGRPSVELWTDYTPMGTLSKALDAAGIRYGMADLPCKTLMHVSLDSVKVAVGYGRPMHRIWPAEHRTEVSP